ncbi:hypothetical protein EVA_04291 [gut metagenome]|uniref:Uncharacterized protein n=1 Tax=gut metagenome TaxID=749906 RepID=J9GX36_9ZZZZ
MFVYFVNNNCAMRVGITINTILHPIEQSTTYCNI